MLSRVKVLTVILLLCAAAVCGYVIGSKLSSAFEKAVIVASCPSVMADIIQSSKGAVYKMDDPGYVEPQLYYLVTYSVNGEEIVQPAFDPIPNELKDEQHDLALQKQAWQLFTTLIPSKDRKMVSEYIIFTDGGDNTLAAVDQTPNDLTHWILEVDVADLDDQDEFLFTLIHEYAHLLTLNDSQASVDADIYKDPYNQSLLESKAANCPNFFTGGGCSLTHSYINTYYQRFWTEINAEWKKIDDLQYSDDLDPYYAGLYHFYLTHQDQFVDDYATTHPAEDIAESFAYFVFSPKPAGDSIRDKKVLFFYDYPQLVDLRQAILKGTCSIAQ